METMDEKYNKEKKNQYLPPEFTPLNAQLFDRQVWEPHYWFFFHTIAHSYPAIPNAVTKRKYYDFIQNIPLFIPNPEVGNEFSRLLDDYPVSPYLDSRDSFIRWVHFIENKRNAFLGKEEISLFASLDEYRNNYKPVQLKISERLQLKKEYIVMVFTVLLLVFLFFFYK
jgi:hypothetical protein